MANPYGLITIVPRTSEFSARSASRTTAWYQAGKSSVKLGSAIRRGRIAAGGLGSARVALDGALVPDGGLVRVLTGVAAGPSLVEQVPALVERHLELGEPLAVGIRRLAAPLALEQLVLLAREVVDPREE